MPKLAVRPPEWIDAAPTIAEASITIDATPADVWAHIADHESWPTWFEAVKKVERIGTGEGVGSGRRVSAGPITFDEEFTVWDENEHFAFAVTSSTLPVFRAMIESVRIEPDGDGRCTVTYRQGLEGHRGMGRLVARLGRRLEGNIETALENLRALVSG